MPWLPLSYIVGKYTYWYELPTYDYDHQTGLTGYTSGDFRWHYMTGAGVWTVSSGKTSYTSGAPGKLGMIFIPFYLNIHGWKIVFRIRYQRATTGTDPSFTFGTSYGMHVGRDPIDSGCSVGFSAWGLSGTGKHIQKLEVMPGPTSKVAAVSRSIEVEDGSEMVWKTYSIECRQNGLRLLVDDELVEDISADLLVYPHILRNMWTGFFIQVNDNIPFFTYDFIETFMWSEDSEPAPERTRASEPGEPGLVFDASIRAFDMSPPVNGDFAKGFILDNAVTTSLFCDRRADEGDPLGPWSDKRGWMFDGSQGVDGDRWGSKLWMLPNLPLNDDAVAQAIEWASESLAWMIDQELVSGQDAIQVDGDILTDDGGMNVGIWLSINIYEPVGNLAISKRFNFVWQEMRQHAI